MPSPLHKVAINKEQERYSMGFFTNISGIVAAPEELIDEEHPRKYKPYNYYGLLDFYAENVELFKECTVKAYASV